MPYLNGRMRSYSQPNDHEIIASSRLERLALGVTRSRDVRRRIVPKRHYYYDSHNKAKRISKPATTNRINAKKCCSGEWVGCSREG